VGRSGFPIKPKQYYPKNPSNYQEGNQTMKFFIDTANVDEIKEAHAMGMVDGVTTNPSLIAKEGRVFEDVIKEICQIVDGPISAEVISLEAEGMVSRGPRTGQDSHERGHQGAHDRRRD
jgi:hypothetical protein